MLLLLLVMMLLSSLILWIAATCCWLASGVVEYLSRDDMKAAVRTLDDTRLGGKYIRVKEVRKKQIDDTVQCCMACLIVS